MIVIQRNKVNRVGKRWRNASGRGSELKEAMGKEGDDTKGRYSKIFVAWYEACAVVWGWVGRGRRRMFTMRRGGVI